MVNFKFAWLFLLLPLPWLIRRLLPAARTGKRGLPVPLLNRPEADRSGIPQTGVLGNAVLWCFWLCLLFAAARPVWVGEPTHRPMNGRDLMLAIDISGSMQEADMISDTAASSRIDVLKLVVSEFVERREGDRLGLILFGTHAHSYVPLTFDRKALNQLLDGVSTGLAGRLTAIGDAIGIAYRTLSEQDSRHRVLILVTDGSNTGGVTDPLAAARIAADNGMTIYTIGIGNDADTMRELVQENNIPPGTILNEELLRGIAAVTGGRYFRARDYSSLEQIYQALDGLEPVALEVQRHRPERDMFHLPLALGCTLFLGFLIARGWIAREVQRV